MVHDHLLDPEHISQFRTLILPNIAALSTAQCKQLEDFVQNGGSLVATYETSLYNEWGVRQQNFGLASLFGVNYAGKVEGPMLNSYLSLNKDPSGQYPPAAQGSGEFRAHHQRCQSGRGDADWRRNVSLAGSPDLPGSSHGRGLPTQGRAAWTARRHRSSGGERPRRVPARRYRPNILGDAELRPGQAPS